MLAKEAVQKVGQTYEFIDPTKINPMELARMYVALLDSGDNRNVFTPQDFPLGFFLKDDNLNLLRKFLYFQYFLLFL